MFGVGADGTFYSKALIPNPKGIAFASGQR